MSYFRTICLEVEVAFQNELICTHTIGLFDQNVMLYNFGFLTPLSSILQILYIYVII